MTRAAITCERECACVSVLRDDDADGSFTIPMETFHNCRDGMTEQKKLTILRSLLIHLALRCCCSCWWWWRQATDTIQMRALQWMHSFHCSTLASFVGSILFSARAAALSSHFAFILMPMPKPLRWSHVIGRISRCDAVPFHT